MKSRVLRRLVFFTDLDGTLLDHADYSWTAAAPAVERLRSLGIPLVLSSSKTRSEMLAMRRALGNEHPFAVENGAAIFVPVGYFGARASETAAPAAATDDRGRDFEVERLGPSRQELLEVLHAIRHRRGFRFKGFSDMSLGEIRRRTGLDEAGAAAAARRDGTEPLVWLDERHDPRDLGRELADHGLRLVPGGRFFHVMGRTDKGTATASLLARYRESLPAVRSVALGDSANDLEMLRAVDYPVVIPRPDGSALDPGPLPGLIRAPSPGAAGWRSAVDQILDRARQEI